MNAKEIAVVAGVVGCAALGGRFLGERLSEATIKRRAAETWAGHPCPKPGSVPWRVYYEGKAHADERGIFQTEFDRVIEKDVYSVGRHDNHVSPCRSPGRITFRPWIKGDGEEY